MYFAFRVKNRIVQIDEGQKKVQITAHLSPMLISRHRT